MIILGAANSIFLGGKSVAWFILVLGTSVFVAIVEYSWGPAPKPPILATLAYHVARLIFI